MEMSCQLQIQGGTVGEGVKGAPAPTFLRPTSYICYSYKSSRTLVWLGVHQWLKPPA